ncbi:bifunctional 3,4-dihydroxy-2-butanone-4-phosphate synthase/GTP cyclohydrolase II [Corynebacterium sp. sy039]|uniref:bifunctional 3,4-dihydroxy-2-butanone-4-phosphate synthase/GTP cyclohydrolase II n=1 Tax=Corynebacterium sp. sy039 TaxID=2599641 RepID=UPI0011B47F33|nr:bifunctional 3,4-dihydroxy-2-butanone-4-phosphate synthase/GTP cyclohydrolase II [Corynebacterium sp. sy039]QDZ43545.1 bifunctional 3,4-dihydroxy-2-butanone-4-phosphate synthase/GTP cyclohydrolase II [Corynebacterium sp. sy039]
MNSATDSSELALDTIDEAISAIAAGEAVVVIDDEDRENEGDLIFAAQKATPELVAFMVRYSSGYICTALTDSDCQRLALPPMTHINEDARQTAYMVTVDANTGSTGISASSRAYTLQQLADERTQPTDFTRPGHIVPLRAREGGVLAREGHTEAAVDLARLAGLRPAAALCEIVSEQDPTDMARAPELRRFATEHGLKMISIKQLKQWRLRHELLVDQVAKALLPTEFGTFTALSYRWSITGQEHIALVMGDVSAAGEPILVRVHSECLTGDIFASRRCDCGQQLHSSLRMIAEKGRGVVIYMRGHEGRGIGITAKLQAYHLQDEGMDTVDANTALGHPVDARDFAAAAHILKDLGVAEIALLTNNPHKVQELGDVGISVVNRIALPVEVTSDNHRYLRTKKERMHHVLPWVTHIDSDGPHLLAESLTKPGESIHE